jgi:hypothetical protein
MTLESASTIGIRTLRVTLLDTCLPNPRKGWGQTLKFQQQTQADDTQAEMFLRAYVTGSSVPDPPCVASYYCLFVCSLNPTDIKKGPPSTTIGGCRASQFDQWMFPVPASHRFASSNWARCFFLSLLHTGLPPQPHKGGLAPGGCFLSLLHTGSSPQIGGWMFPVTVSHRFATSTSQGRLHSSLVYVTIFSCRHNF